jgi:hypothetical protein
VNTRPGRRLLLAWLALAGITLLSLWMGRLEGRGAPTPNAVVAASAIVIGLVKTRIIFREFMEVRHAPVLLGRLTDLWLVLTGAILVGVYLAGLASGR